MRGSGRRLSRAAIGWLGAVARVLDLPMQALVSDGPDIYRPLLILGPERSGTTLLYSLLSNHPDLYWLSRLDSMIPRSPVLASGIRAVVGRLPGGRNVYHAVPGTISRSRGLLPPSECLPYWRGLFGWGDEEDYRIEDDRVRADDLSDRTRERVHADLRKRLAILSKLRLLLKQPGFSLKIPYLNALFPDALFLHCVRDPLDNLLSLVKVKRASAEGYWGIKVPGWREDLGVEPSLQAARQLDAVAQIIEDDIGNLSGLSERYFRIRMEELQDDPELVMRRLLERCQLPESPAIREAVRYVAPRRADKDYTQLDLSAEVREIIERLAQRYGYAVPRV